jgi:hypothetical protein
MRHIDSSFQSVDRGPNTDGATMLAGGLNFVAGIWLIASGFILGFANQPTALWNDIVVGIIVLAVAWIRLGNFGSIPNIAWVNLAAGIWLFFSPWILRYADSATPLWNNLILGFIVVLLSAWGLGTAHRRHVAG